MFAIMLAMSSNLYQGQVERYRRDVADLEGRIARERTQAARAREQALRARRSISATASASVLRSKLSEIDRYESRAVDHEKAAARLMTQAASRNRSLADAQAKLERAITQESRRSTVVVSGGRPVPVTPAFIGIQSAAREAEPLPKAFAPGFRIVMFTDIQDSTLQAHTQGDAAALATVNNHDTLVRAVVASRNGVEVKHTGDGLMVAFDGLLDALHAAIEIQRAVDAHNQSGSAPLHLRIGLAAGEPLPRGRDLIGATVQMAARMTDLAPPDGILVPIGLRDLARGSGLVFHAADTVTPQGLDEPIPTYALGWRPEDYTTKDSDA
jgi:class 3 adenylate cyclase